MECGVNADLEDINDESQLRDNFDLIHKRFYCGDKVSKETNLDMNLIKSMCLSYMPASSSAIK